MPPRFERFRFAESADRHGYGPADVREMLKRRPLVLKSRRGQEHGYEILGRNAGGEYLHVVGRVLIDQPDRPFFVYHINRMYDRDRRRYRVIRGGSDG